MQIKKKDTTVVGLLPLSFQMLRPARALGRIIRHPESGVAGRYILTTNNADFYLEGAVNPPNATNANAYKR